MIASKDDKTHWISSTEWDSYSAMVRKAGCLIVGRRTYHILTQQPEFAEFKDVHVVVVSKDPISLVADNHRVAHSPKEALEMLTSYEQIVVAGGGVLNASFLTEGLIDEIYVDIEPIILGEGIPLFQAMSLEQGLELMDQKLLSKHEIQLYYKVVKKA